MSYDIFCYKSKSGIPDEEEADTVINADTDKWAKKDGDTATKLAIVKALLTYNPKLESFDFHYGEIAKLDTNTIEKEKNKFDHIEINSSNDSLSIQIIVYDNHVFITVPYTYKSDDAKKIFADIAAYVRIIRETAGYFVFDRQTGQTFDPAVNEFDGLAKYLSVSDHFF
jgi:hypothetical protein